MIPWAPPEKANLQVSAAAADAWCYDDRNYDNGIFAITALQANLKGLMFLSFATPQVHLLVQRGLFSSLGYSFNPSL